MLLDLIYTQQAFADLDDIYWFIADDNPQRAKTYINEIKEACGALCTTPDMGVSRADIFPSLRILPLWKKVIIAYKITDTCVEILRVFSGGQDYATIMQSE